MVVLPSDHIINRPEEFRRVVRAGCRWAWTKGRSVVVGIEPTRAETGYGYLRRGAIVGRAEGRRIYRVEKFTEKPNGAVARRYVASGKYLWNGGMFIWRASTLLDHFERFQPAVARSLSRIARTGGVRARVVLKSLYPRLPKISIDYALMEKIPDVFVVPADIGWSDVGSWATVYELTRKDAQGNVQPSQCLSLNAWGNMIVSESKYVVCVGIRDLVLVETPDALLISALERSQDVGKAVEELERRKRIDLL
jgi:mannose-1-phosphate guanylyltransferase